ncbi:VirB6/TrbL-like conjugal transfer protein, CD1112 family [Caryophanon latum]|uniref:Conjugal transfer protein TrbL n=1 Tax=Caryophanon latum TaxID=33977 RepID=A0A1C0Z1W3_9BACL|nr:CD0415/CD1112 family protein [Caryophanon latum]OCS93346.1 hypothetical protein A6K76_05480 [Caryophanon latum]
MFDSLIESLQEWLLNALLGFVKWNLDLTHSLFQSSVDSVRENVSETPIDFSPMIVENLQIISDTAIMPVAGLILTYIFCYEIYELVVEKNKGNDFETGQLLFLIIKTAAAILLITNAFDITLAFFDLGKWITDKVPATTLVIPDSVTTNLVDSVDNIGAALGMSVLAIIVLLITFLMAGIIYLVAWSRIIVILLYVSVAPIPFATMMNREWIGSIGQNYIKQLIALMLQGFFMIVCLVIYAGLLDKTTTLITQQNQPVFGLLLLLVSMGILTITLTRTHSLAKSVVGVV